MRIMADIINKLVKKQKSSAEPKEICLAQEPVKMTIVPVSMEQVAEEVDTVMPKKIMRRRTSRVSKSCTTNTAAKNKKRYSPIIKSKEDLEREMQAAYNRINYLKSKAKNQFKKAVPVEGKSLVTGKDLQRDKDYHFFRFWMRQRPEGVLEKKYLKLKKTAVESSKAFSVFHGRLFDVVQKFGTAEDKDYVLSLMEKEY